MSEAFGSIFVIMSIISMSTWIVLGFFYIVDHNNSINDFIENTPKEKLRKFHAGMDNGWIKSSFTNRLRYRKLMRDPDYSIWFHDKLVQEYENEEGEDRW